LIIRVVRIILVIVIFERLTKYLSPVVAGLFNFMRVNNPYL